MFRDNTEFKPKTKTVNFILLDGGVGDHIASLSALNHVYVNYPWIIPLIWTPDYLVDFAKNVLPEEAKIKGLSQMRGNYEPTKPTKTTKWDGYTSPMKMHGVDYAFLKLLDETPPNREYLQIKLDKIQSKEFDLPEKYIVITTGYTADVREFLPSEINKVADYALSKGYTPVFIGQKNTTTGVQHIIKGEFKAEINFKAGINLIDQTTLLEAAAIMHHAAAVVGVDNGLLHVAGCTQAPIVGGFTTVDPKYRIPDRNGMEQWMYYTVLPDNDLKCRFCQSNTNFLYGHDYKKCIYNDNLCTKQITAEKFIYHLQDIL